MTATAAVAMTAEQAAWVRAAAWRSCHRRDYAEVPAIFTDYSCRSGACGYCRAGQHEKCAYEEFKPWERPAGYVTDRRGGVVAEVYEVGHRHTPACTCWVADHYRPRQLPLF